MFFNYSKIYKAKGTIQFKDDKAVSGNFIINEEPYKMTKWEYDTSKNKA